MRNRRFHRRGWIGLRCWGLGLRVWEVLETSEVEREVGESEEPSPKERFSDHLGVWCERGWQEERGKRNERRVEISEEEICRKFSLLGDI